MACDATSEALDEAHHLLLSCLLQLLLRSPLGASFGLKILPLCCRLASSLGLAILHVRQLQQSTG